MVEPVIVPREAHVISRSLIDPDALKVLYRLRDFNYTAYLVGGGVRDLLLGRTPKDFDVGTDAHPYQIKKLFRNCWIIGRRFRLAHVRFGLKTIEVATFRRNLPNDEPVEEVVGPGGGVSNENTFGTPEEDAFRRDFTINALFYDIATFSVIDYVGGLDDLQRGIIRCIGDPYERFQEDPVRMLRAVAFAARLGFTLDPPIVEAMADQRQLMGQASPARLIEEYYKILRSGSAAATFRLMAQHGLLDAVTPELQRRAAHQPLWTSLEALDQYRKRYVDLPPQLTNPVLLGSLLLPLGLMPKAAPAVPDHDVDSAVETNTGAGSSTDDGADDAPRTPSRGRPWVQGRRERRPKPPVLKFGTLPVARRDSERLRQLLSMQGRLRDLEASPRARRTLMSRGPFEDALTWLTVHGASPEVIEHWKGFIEAVRADAPDAAQASHGEGEGAAQPGEPRRRRRRRGGRRRGGAGRRPEPS
ncbi:MAG: polynucleotide adenylyltransferase PcnB [Acidobacteria bacterium]|nr:polynucleotide adenylyltransferase PcnB [Acidobacteriota bacterium]